MENPPKKFFRLSPGTRGAAALRLFHHLPRGGEERRRRGGRTALHLRSGDARRQRAGRPQGARRRCTGFRRRMRCRPRCGSTIRCSRSPIPNAGDFAADLNPQSLEVLPDARVEPALAGARIRRAGAVRAAGLFLPRPGFHGRPARVQPHGRLARHLGQGVRRRKLSGRVARLRRVKSTRKTHSVRRRARGVLQFGGRRALLLRSLPCCWRARRRARPIRSLPRPAALPTTTGPDCIWAAPRGRRGDRLASRPAPRSAAPTFPIRRRRVR